MGANRGKELEEKVKEALIREYDNGVDFIRLYDITMGYAGIKNPCDFVASKQPVKFYIECKSTNENTYNLAKLTQYEDLLEHSRPDVGVRAGIILWFIEHKETYWVDIRHIEGLKKLNIKSVNIKALREINVPNDLIFKIDGVTKRVFTEYALKSFFDYYTQNDD